MKSSKRNTTVPLLDSSRNTLDFLDPEQASFHLDNIQIPRTCSADHNFCSLVFLHNLLRLGHLLVSRRLNSTQICKNIYRMYLLLRNFIQY